jgi:hypothetical protein
MIMQLLDIVLDLVGREVECSFGSREHLILFVRSMVFGFDF